MMSSSESLLARRVGGVELRFFPFEGPAAAIGDPKIAFRSRVGGGGLSSQSSAASRLIVEARLELNVVEGTFKTGLITLVFVPTRHGLLERTKESSLPVDDGDDGSL